MRIKYFVLALFPFIFSAAAQADVRIATVDVARILNDSPEAVTKKKELDTLSEETKKKLENKAKDLQALKTKLENSKVSADSKEAESFRNQARDFERMRGDAKTDLEKKYMKVNKELTDKVLGRIETYAKANDYDLVFDKSDRFRGPVLFGSEAVDITDEVLKSSR
jgi:Skp family chaperone for outer membrane proteins